jgi:hypothetical protein
MDKICELINDANNELYTHDIKYYVKQSGADLISYDYFNYFEATEYIADKLHEYFYKYNYDIVNYYNDASVYFSLNKNDYNISSKLLNNDYYWILSIKFNRYK